MNCFIKHFAQRASQSIFPFTSRLIGPNFIEGVYQSWPHLHKYPIIPHGLTWAHRGSISLIKERVWWGCQGVHLSERPSHNRKGFPQFVLKQLQTCPTSLSPPSFSSFQGCFSRRRCACHILFGEAFPPVADEGWHLRHRRFPTRWPRFPLIRLDFYRLHKAA